MVASNWSSVRYTPSVETTCPGLTRTLLARRSTARMPPTVAATRAATDEALLAAARSRALALMAEGVTTLEIKSGYGLSAEH